MITLLSKALQLRRYFYTDDEASVHQILLSSAHVRFCHCVTKLVVHQELQT